MKNKIFAACTIATLLMSAKVMGQVNVPGSLAYPIDKYSDTTTVGLYKSIQYQKEGLNLIDPLLMTGFNTGYARGYNDGALWRGPSL